MDIRNVIRPCIIIVEFSFCDFMTRCMLRVYFGVLGIVVTTAGQSKHPKVNMVICAH